MRILVATILNCLSWSVTWQETRRQFRYDTSRTERERLGRETWREFLNFHSRRKKVPSSFGCDFRGFEFRIFVKTISSISIVETPTAVEAFTAVGASTAVDAMYYMYYMYYKWMYFPPPSFRPCPGSPSHVETAIVLLQVKNIRIFTWLFQHVIHLHGLYYTILYYRREKQECRQTPDWQNLVSLDLWDTS